MHWHHPSRTKSCAICKEVKPLSDFYAYGYTTRQGKRSTRYESRCRPCAQKRRRDAIAQNPELARAQSRAWRAANPHITADLCREYRQTPSGRAMKAKAQRLRKARARSGQGDNAAIRAIYAEAVEIERLVANCPLFDLPELGHKMHVDHRIPLARGGLHHEDNLQILPAGINMRKGVSCPK